MDPKTLKNKQTTAALENATSSDDRVHVVAVGGAAGGIEAFLELLQHLNISTLDAAVVFITHLSTKHETRLAKVFSAVKSMPVVAVSGTTNLQANTVYVNTEHSDLTIRNNYLVVVPRVGGLRQHRPIDLFFESLADDRKDRAVAVLLSGTGTDGTLGLHAIQNAQGRAYAQLPESAKHSDMVQNAISEGFVDQSLPLDRLAAAIRAPLSAGPVERFLIAEQPQLTDDEAIRVLLTQLHQSSGIDFSKYRRAGVLRRIRYALQKSGHTSLAAYASFLRSSPAALASFFELMLIHVTAFFRDPTVYQKLNQKIFPELFRHRDAGKPVRIWVPGCSTGEEAYSVAIAYYEYAQAHGHNAPLQLFASDLSETVIATARAGSYPDAAASTIDEGVLRKYFSKAAGQIVVNDHLRTSCVFSRHHVSLDPPFSQLDLITCRNLLIYLDSGMQAQALSAFHYALRDPGFLLLGRSESAGPDTDMFTEVDRAAKIYRRVSTRVNSVPRSRAPPPEACRWAPFRLDASVSVSNDLSAVVDAGLRQLFTPASLVVDESLKIFDVRGRIDLIFAPMVKPLPATLTRMAPARLVSAIRRLVQRSKKEAAPIHQAHVEFTRDGERCTVHLDVAVLPRQVRALAPLYLIVISAFTRSSRLTPARFKQQNEHVKDRLEGELEEGHGHIRALAHHHQRGDSSSGALNDELFGSNEALQSLNEELATAKEEMGSINEELTTLNEELQLRNTALVDSNSDLFNVIIAIDMPLIIIDRQRRIRRYTAGSGRFISCIPSDLGRRLDDLSLNFKRPTLMTDIQKVIDQGGLIEFEASMPDDEFYTIQLRPYLDKNGVREGAIMCFVRITASKKLLARIEEARDWAQTVIEAVPQPLAVLSRELVIVKVNDAFVKMLSTSHEMVTGRNIFESNDKLGRPEALRKLLVDARNAPNKTFYAELCVGSRGESTQTVAAVARAVVDQSGAYAIVMGFEDVTERRASERQAGALEAERQARIKAEKAGRAKDDFLAVLSHELRTPLAAISLRAQLMLHESSLSPDLRNGLQLIESAADTQTALIEDLLDVSRIVAGKMRLQLENINFRDVVMSSVDASSSQARKKGVELICELDAKDSRVSGDAVRLQQVVGNLINNAIKFTPSGGRCLVKLCSVGPLVLLDVTDNGAGLTSDLKEKIFDRFTQKDSSSSRQYGGLGLGLPLARHITEMHGGIVEADSDGPGQGTTFRVTLPLKEEAPRTMTNAGHGSLDGAMAEIDLVGRSVLVIDDDAFLRESVKETLMHAGMQVRAAASANEGLESLHHFLPQVVLCDINMPGKDGYAFLRNFRERAASEQGIVPVIAITALAGSHDKRLIAEKGFVLRLIKPFKIASLLKTVRAAIARADTD